MNTVVVPPPLKSGATWGIFSPSTPGAAIYPDIYLRGLDQLHKRGFKTKEGFLTASRSQQGYRSGSPKDRAREFMDLYLDPEVDALMAVLGGTSSASLIPYLDFKAIALKPKVVCGFSDVTSLHLALLKYSGLSTFYGPSVVRSLGREIHLDFTMDSFLKIIRAPLERQVLTPPKESTISPLKDFSNTGTTTHQNSWQTLNPGDAEGPIVAVNLNTLLRAAGTAIFPDLSENIVMIEEMNLPLSKFERNFRQLEQMGTFQKISGLLISKPEKLDLENAPFTLQDLTLEILDETLRTRKNFPVIANFDGGHTYPQITLRQQSKVRLIAESRGAPQVIIN